MRLVGPIFILFFYLLLSVHIYAHFAVVLFVLKKRLGVMFGLLWVAIGASLFYNIVYNQFFAMIVKAGGPKDLKVKKLFNYFSRKWSRSGKILSRERARKVSSQLTGQVLESEERKFNLSKMTGLRGSPKTSRAS